MNLPVTFKKTLGLDKSFFSNDFFSGFFEDFDRYFGACCYVNESGEGVYKIEVPGFNKDNLNVELADGILTINGNRKVKDKNYAGKSTFYKRLTVGDAEDAKAEIKDGILTLTIKSPDKIEDKEIKKIEVE